MHVLDRPIWNTLINQHSEYSDGGLLVKKYFPHVLPFAALSGGTPEHWRALFDLAETGHPMILIQDQRITNKTSVPMSYAEGVQMVADEWTGEPDSRVRQLGDEDFSAICSLLEMTWAAPVSQGMKSVQSFWGLERNGQLIALAGRRFEHLHYAKISGVCTHPDYRGQGLAKALTAHLTHLIRADSKIPYLHVHASNTAALSLYETLSFRMRKRVFSG